MVRYRLYVCFDSECKYRDEIVSSDLKSIEHLKEIYQSYGFDTILLVEGD